MNQIPARLPLLSLKLQRSQTRSVLHTRTWAQQQGLNNGRRQFHASSSQRSALPEAVELWQTIHPVWLGLPAAAIAPHFLRLGWDLHQTRILEKRLEKVEPLMDICDSIVEKRIKKLSATAVSTKVDADRLGWLNKLGTDFRNRLTGVHGTSLGVREHNTVLPPVLHFWWTVLAVGVLSPAGPVSAAVAELPGMSTAFTLLGDHPIVSVLLLCLGGWSCLNYNPFRNLATRSDVERMSPFWRLLTGFQWNRSDPPKSPFVVPTWLYYLRPDRFKFEAYGQAKSTADDPLVHRQVMEQGISFDYIYFNIGLWALSTYIIVKLAPLQTLYLLGSVTGQGIRRAALYIESKKVEKKKTRRQKRWMPLSPGYNNW